MKLCLLTKICNQALSKPHPRALCGELELKILVMVVVLLHQMVQYGTIFPFKKKVGYYTILVGKYAWGNF
jgi:hypothetical protein